MSEQLLAELLALLTEDLLDRRPDDPLDHLINLLSFPFARPRGALRDATLCETCGCSGGVLLSAVSQQELRPCCVYSLTSAFGGPEDDATEVLCRFLSSEETLLIVVGDPGEGVGSGRCDCTSSGKSRLARWLDVPGRFLHKRRVACVNGTNVLSLVDTAEAGQSAALGDVEPTLTIIDGLEPPHKVLHTLLHSNYFKANHRRCARCDALCRSALHKTIVFLRPGTFFAFPLPAAMLTIVRNAASSVVHSPKVLAGAVASFSSLVGPAHGGDKSQRRGKRLSVNFSDEKTEVTKAEDATVIAMPPQRPMRYEEHPELSKASRLISILHELCDQFLSGPLTLDWSATFSHATQSRIRVETLLGDVIVKNLLELKLDLSALPTVAHQMVHVAGVDYYFAKSLEDGMRRPYDPLLFGNLLCLAVASQQSLSPYPLAATASEMLEWCLCTPSHNLPREQSSTDDVELVRCCSGVSLTKVDPQQEGINVLNLQNLVVPTTLQPSHPGSFSLIDLRGALADYEFVVALLRPVASLQRTQSLLRTPSSLSDDSSDRSALLRLPSEFAASRCFLLTSEVTDVGRRGFDGPEPPTAAQQQRQRNAIGPNVMFCFVVSVPSEGVPVVLVVERHRVYARRSFTRDESDADIEDALWQVHFLPPKTIVHATLQRECARDSTRAQENLALLLGDGSVCLLAVDRIPQSSATTICGCDDERNAGSPRFVSPPTTKPPPPGRGRRLSSDTAPTPTRGSSGAAGARSIRSVIRRDSRVTMEGVGVGEFSFSSRSDSSVESEETIDLCLSFVDKRSLSCEDPHLVCLSERWIAASSHDSDIVCVCSVSQASVLHTECPGVAVLQAESNVTAMCIVDEAFLVAGLSDGKIQAFAADSGREVCSFEVHHEAQINVIRALCTPRPSFVAGAEDCVMSVYAMDETELQRAIRLHNSPLLDIAATHFGERGILVSADRTGTVVVSHVDLSRSSHAAQILWSSSLVGLSTLHLSRDASWLVCTRVQNTPVAVPIAEWCRQGTGQFHQRPISALHITASEDCLLTGGDDGLIFVWDLRQSLRCKRCFQQHPRNSSITSISTTQDIAKVVSTDSVSLACIWELSTGALLRILVRSAGGCVAKYIAHDFLVVHSARGIKVFDEKERLFCTTGSAEVSSCFDVFVAPDELCPYLPQRAPIIDSGGDENGEMEGAPLPIEANMVQECMRRQCFLGIAKNNTDKGSYSVQIFRLGDLQTPVSELLTGDVEDEFGDEEELCHSDRITAFSFLQPRSACSLGAPRAGAAPPAPTIFLAATGAEDLTVILWNWRRGEPLKMLQHTDFVTGCVFSYPRLGLRSGYPEDRLQALSKMDPSFRACEDTSVVCHLVTSQYADSSNHTSLRVFEIREANRAFQKRLLAQRCGQPLNAATFPYSALAASELSTAKVPVDRWVERSSVTCIAVRRSDGLLCTGDQTCQLVFWRLHSSRAKKAADAPTTPRSVSEGDVDDGVSLGDGAVVQLHPLRRMVSRV